MTKMYDINKINALPILDVAERLDIDVKKKGVRYKALCLWHNDTHPSMVIGGKYNNCHCYACGESHNVIDLVMAKRGVTFLEACEWLAGQYGDKLLLPDVEVRKKPCTPVSRLMAISAKAEKENKNEGFHYFPSTYLDGNDGMKSSFALCMKQVFGANVTADVVRMYHLGSKEACGRFPDVMFPSIDIKGRIRDIKVQAYDCYKLSDRFFHRDRRVCYWLGKVVYGYDDFNRDCLFGEHLLCFHPDKKVALVESPKNACIGAAVTPEWIWVATGSKGMLCSRILKVLRGRTVLVFADKDAAGEWEEKLKPLVGTENIFIADIPSLGDKDDIADWILANKDNICQGLKIRQLSKNVLHDMYF